MTTATRPKLTARQAKVCRQLREFLRLANELHSLADEITAFTREEMIELVEDDRDGRDIHNNVLGVGVMCENAESMIQSFWPRHLPRPQD